MLVRPMSSPQMITMFGFLAAMCFPLSRDMREGLVTTGDDPRREARRNRTVVQVRTCTRVQVRRAEASAAGGRRLPGDAGVRQEVGYVNELGERAGFHLRHHLPAMHLDRALGDAELVGDLLIELSCHDAVEDGALALGESLVSCLRLAGGFPIGTRGAVPSERGFDGLHEHCRLYRLG